MDGVWQVNHAVPRMTKNQTPNAKPRPINLAVDEYSEDCTIERLWRRIWRNPKQAGDGISLDTFAGFFRFWL
jgi:hypothetical protein